MQDVYKFSLMRSAILCNLKDQKAITIFNSEHYFDTLNYLKKQVQYHVGHDTSLEYYIFN